MFSRILSLKQKNYVHWNGKEGLSLWPLELHSSGFDFYGWQLVNLGVALSKWIWPLCSVQFSSSVVSNSLRPWGLQPSRLPVHCQFPEVTQTHVHWGSNAIQPSHPLSSPNPPALNLSQHQGLFQWISSSHQVAKVLELQHQAFQWIFRTDFL